MNALAFSLAVLVTVVVRWEAVRIEPQVVVDPLLTEVV